MLAQMHWSELSEVFLPCSTTSLRCQRRNRMKTPQLLNYLRTFCPFSLNTVSHPKPYGQRIEASAVGVGVAYAVVDWVMVSPVFAVVGLVTVSPGFAAAFP